MEDADWSPDGTSLAVTRDVGNRGRVEYPVGKVLYDTAGWAGSVRVSPDGRLVAFIDHPQKGDNNGTLKVVDVNGKVRLNGPFSIRGLAWSPRGDEVFSGDSRGISATTLDGKSRIVWLAPGGGVADIARDGRILCMMNSSRREMVGLAPGEKAERNLTWLNWSFPIDISSDGGTILFNEQNLEPMGIYLRKLDGSTAVRLGEGNALGFSPDGRWALSIKKLDNGQFTLLPTGAGEPKELAKTGIAINSATYFPDGKRILISGNEPGHGARLFVQDIAERKRPAPSARRASASSSPHSPRTGNRSWPPDRTVDSRSTRSSRASPARCRDRNRKTSRCGGRSTGAAIFVYHPSAPPLKVETIDVKTGQTHALERAPASGSVRRRAGRPDQDLAGREVVRVFLPAHARRALSRDRYALSR